MVVMETLPQALKLTEEVPRRGRQGVRVPLSCL
jgi:hypothetical protein